MGWFGFRGDSRFLSGKRLLTAAALTAGFSAVVIAEEITVCLGNDKSNYMSECGVCPKGMLVSGPNKPNGKPCKGDTQAPTPVSASDSSTEPNKEPKTKLSQVDALREQGYSVKAVTPIFSQLLMLSFPKGFTPVFENATGPQYIQEAVLQGESTAKWSQMITLTGAKDLASNPKVTPEGFAAKMADGFKRSCPNSFNGAGLGAIKLEGHEAYGALLGCGTALPTGEPYSEAVLLIVIKGERDYYTVQWAERGKASKTPYVFEEAKWTERIKRLAPIKLCPRVPGEKAPYPSCINHA